MQHHVTNQSNSMDNDALMRRITAATDLKKAATASTPSASLERQQARTSIAQPSIRMSQPRPIAPLPTASAADAPQPVVQHSAPVPAPPIASSLPPIVASPTAQPLAQSTASIAPQAPMTAVEAVAAQPIPEIVPAPTPPSVEEDELLIFTPPPVSDIPPSDLRPMRKEDRPQAFVIACDGNMAVVQGDTNCIDTVTGLTWAVGRMLSMTVGTSRVVGMICDISMADGHFTENNKSILHFKVELQGEVSDGPDGQPTFVKGITSYPGVGSIVHQIRVADLASLYAATGSKNGIIGTLSQDTSIPALVDVADMLSKHFAVLGSTGCGKSASVSLLLHAAQEIVPDLRTIILDPHNEYSRAFPTANTVTQPSLDLPFWMFQLEEYVEVLFRGKPLVHEELDALREFIPVAKVRFRDGEDRVKLRSNSGTELTADSAAPYRMADLLSLIDDEMGLLESRYEKTTLKSLRARINAHCTDSRYAFMFRHKTIEDIAQRVISHFFCLPGNGSFTTIIQMAGMPAEVVNAVASVLCRLSFELAIAAKGNLKILVVCEEAHRYVPAGQDGFEPTRRAIARIAKEGRKYGSFMAIISQRPSELDPTILSQCSTVFSLRLTNDFDQDIIRRAISSSSASTISFISSLSNRECIAFGEGMSTPMRLKFRNLPKHWLPGAEADVFGNSNPVMNPEQAANVFHQWRGISQ